MSGPGFNPNSVRASMKVAEKEPTRFPAAERGIMVRDMIRKVETLQKEGKTLEEIRNEVKDFVTNYPRLFEMVTRPGYDKSQVRTMLAMLDRMGSGELSQHQASMIVGQKVFNTYVTPSLKNATDNRVRGVGPNDS
jgi:hypothetical protein